jgi:hypothetical protein
MSAPSATYRDAPASKGARRPLSRVHLAGLPRHVHRALASMRIVALLVASVAFFLPWHVVHPLSNGSWGDAFCWAPDCHNGPPAPPSPPTYGPQYTCTGWSHANTALPMVLLALLIVMALVPFRRPKFGVAVALAFTSIAVLVGLAFALFDLKHMFDHVEVLAAERVFGRAMGFVALMIVADVVVTPVLYLWARARLLRA